MTLKIQVSSTRVIYVYYTKQEYTFRKIYVDCGFRVSEVKCYTKSSVYTEHCDRFGFTPKPEANFALRYCTYVVGAQVLINSTPVTLSLTYHSDRKLFVDASPYSQRFGLFVYSTWSELQILCCREQVTHVASPIVSTSTRTLTERSIEFKVGDITSRFCITVYEDVSERLCLCTRKIDSVLYTPLVKTTIKDIFTERKICLGEEPIHSEIKLWVEVSKITERFIGVKYTLTTDRLCTVQVMNTLMIDMFKIVYARLEYTERTGYCTSFAYNTERKCFCECRKLYEIKTPLSTTPAITIRSDKFPYTSVKLLTDRMVEHYGLENSIIEKLDDTASSKLIIQSEENEIAVSAVDYLGAAISKDINKAKELLTGISIELNIGYTHVTERCVFVDRVMYITERLAYVGVE